MKADRNRSPRICAAATVALMLSATIAHAVESAASGPAGKRTAEQVHLDTTTIKGHQGLPRVLYIVPWKRSDAGDLQQVWELGTVDGASTGIAGGDFDHDGKTDVQHERSAPGRRTVV